MPDESLPPISPAATRAGTTSIILPGDANTHGAAFGGALMGLIDLAGAVPAQRHCRSKCVTASFDRVDFLAPLRVGFLVELDARINYVGRSSMEVEVIVTGEHPRTGERNHVCHAFCTYVSLDDDLHPKPVPPLALENDEDRRRFEEGRQRVEQRKATRPRLPAH